MVNLIEPNARPQWQREFPDFPAADMPPIPAGFVDASWHNEAGPGFISDALGLQVWIAEADAAAREFPESPRFGVVGLTFTADGWQIDNRNRDFYSGDSWGAAMLAVLVNSDHGRRERARAMGEASRALHVAVSTIYRLYDASGHGGDGDLRLNTEQPTEETDSAFAASVDEWALECHGLAEAWEALAAETRAPGVDVHTGGNVWARRYELAGNFAVYGPALEHDETDADAGFVVNAWPDDFDPDDGPAECMACEVFPEFAPSYPTFAAAAAAVAAFLGGAQ